MASGERTLVIRLGGKCLYPLSHLVNLGFSPTEAAKHTLQGHMLLGVCASLHLSVMPGEVEGGWNCDTAPPVPSPVSAWTPPQVPSGWSKMRLKSSKEARIPTATSPLIELKLGRLFCQASVRMGRIMSLRRSQLLPVTGRTCALGRWGLRCLLHNQCESLVPGGWPLSIHTGSYCPATFVEETCHSCHLTQELEENISCK